MTPRASLLSFLSGLVLLGCAAYTALLNWKLWPLLSGASWQDSDVTFHLGTQAVLLFLSALAGVLALLFSAWLRDTQNLAARRAFQVTAWAFKLVSLAVPLAYIAVQLQGHGDPYGPSHMLLPGVFSAMSIALTVLFSGPLCALAWVVLTRLTRWMNAVSTNVNSPKNTPNNAEATQPSPAGQLQRLFRSVSHPLLGSALVLIGFAAFLLPVQLVDRAPSIAIQTPLQTALLDQQPALMHVFMLAALSGALALWYWRVAARDLTHALDPQHSRVAAALQAKQSGTGGTGGTATP